MTDVIDKLDETMLGLFSNDGIKFYGLCDLIRKNNQVHPVTIKDKKQVSINDRWDVISYHRLLQASLTPSEEQRFGRKTGKKFLQSVRTVVATRASKGEGWVHSFAQSIPETLTVENYEFINIEAVSLILDQQAVYTAEFGDTAYEKQAQAWNVYALEYDIEFIKCL